jgi:pimeloyl-ACP methyl ester carboxylesterase
MNSKIESPTLILYGTIDQLVPKSSVKFVKKYATNAKIIELNGISHLMFNSTNVRELTETVLNFLCKDDLDE